MEVLKQREGIDTFRDDRIVIRRATSDAGRRELANELRMLESLRITGYVSSLHHTYRTKGKVDQVDEIRTYYYPPTHDVVDEAVFRMHCIRLLHELRHRGIVHGDLTGPNIIVWNDKPIVIDWGEAVYLHEGKTPKRPEGDAYHMWDFMRHHKDGSRIARRWFAMRRVMHQLRSTGGYLSTHNAQPPTFMDIGCYHGDMVAAASVEGYTANGIDHSSGALATARMRFPLNQMKVGFRQDLVDGAYRFGPVNVVSMLSTFPYILNLVGLYEATQVIENVIRYSDLFFFECQLAGDGPGPDWLDSTDAVKDFLAEHGNVSKIVEIELRDRNTTRAVFAVSS